MSAVLLGYDGNGTPITGPEFTPSFGPDVQPMPGTIIDRSYLTRERVPLDGDTVHILSGDTMNTDPSVDHGTLAQINSLVSNVGGLGLTIWSNVTGRPIITGQAPGGSPVPIDTVTSGLSSLAVILAIGVGVYLLTRKA